MTFQNSDGSKIHSDDKSVLFDPSEIFMSFSADIQSKRRHTMIKDEGRQGFMYFPSQLDADVKIPAGRAISGTSIGILVCGTSL